MGAELAVCLQLIGHVWIFVISSGLCLRLGGQRGEGLLGGLRVMSPEGEQLEALDRDLFWRVPDSHTHGSPPGHCRPLGDTRRCLETLLVVTAGWVLLASRVQRPGMG